MKVVFVVGISTALLLSVVAARAMSDRYEAQGATGRCAGMQPGEVLPRLTAYNLDGDPVILSDLWKDRPTVLVTGSITCPISTKNCPSLKPLADGIQI